MGWGTYFYTWKYFSKDTFNDKSDVEEKLAEVNTGIKRVENELHSLAIMTEPKKFMPDEDDDPVWWISTRVKELLEELDEYYCQRYDYEMLIERWGECHDKETGLAIPEPNDKVFVSFMSGDFIKTTKNPTGE